MRLRNANACGVRRRACQVIQRGLHHGIEFDGGCHSRHCLTIIEKANIKNYLYDLLVTRRVYEPFMKRLSKSYARSIEWSVGLAGTI